VGTVMSGHLDIEVDRLVFRGMTWGEAAGAPVLCLHGFPQRCTSWSGVAERLAARGLRVVAMDQRGYSPGARPTEVESYALPHLVDDVVAMIGALGAAVHLVGHDWGGVVGWQVAARHPDLVRSWTAVSTPNQSALNEVLARDEGQRQRFGYIAQFRERGEELLLADGAAALRAIYGGYVAADRVAEDVEFFQKPGALTAALSWYRAMSLTDAAGLPNVVVPTAYVWGSADPAFGAEAAELTARFVDGPYRFVPLQGASHWLPDEVPDTLAEVIAEQVAAGG
jgi:pimeloyl-ACP methyl ester carboxylesterase